MAVEVGGAINCGLEGGTREQGGDGNVLQLGLGDGYGSIAYVNMRLPVQLGLFHCM